MNEKTKKIVGWVLSGLLAAVFIASAVNKLLGNANEMMTGWGFTEGNIMLIGIVEIICAVLFLIPKTSVIGVLLLASYMGGAIATHMQHGDPYFAQCLINALVWIAGFVRNPAMLASFRQ